MSQIPVTADSSSIMEFNETASVKLPRSCGYIYNNLIQYYDLLNNISYYAVVNGYEVWICKHRDPEKLANPLLSNNNNRPLSQQMQLRKVAYDKLDSISCVNWCEFNNNMTMPIFVMGTNTGNIYMYDFDAKKLLCTHEIDSGATINCISSNNKNKLFIGTSLGDVYSYEMDDIHSNIKIVEKTKKLIFKCDADESINCISRPQVTNPNNVNNKIYIGCNDGSVIQYDYFTNDLVTLIEKQQQNHINNISKILNKNNKNIRQNDDDKFIVNNCGSCICIASCNQFIVCGYSSGHIKIIEKTELSFIIKQISMHRRLITSIAIYPELSLIATVSEDGYFHIIRLSEDGYCKLIRSAHFKNCILMGVKFNKSKHYSLVTGNQHNKYKDKIILCTAYDRNRIVFT